MRKTMKNNFSLYEMIVLNGYVTSQDLYYLHYSDKQIAYLIKMNILVQKDDKYYIGSIPELYYYFEMLINKRENILARSFYNKLMELKPTYKANYFELMEIALRYGDYYASYNYCKKLDAKNDYLYDKNLYLFLFSVIIKLSKDDIKYVKKLELRNLCVQENDQRYKRKNKENSIREDIFNFNFSKAKIKINEKAYYNKKFQTQDVMIKTLCDVANSKKEELEKKIRNLIINDKFDELNKLLQSIEKQRNLTRFEKQMKYLLLKYEAIAAGELPQKTDKPASTIFEALRLDNYELALSLCYQYQKEHNIKTESTLMIFLSKIINKIKLNPKNSYEESDKYLSLYKFLFPILNRIINNKDLEIIYVESENNVEILKSIMSTFNNIKCYYLDNNMLITYVEVTKDDNVDNIVKRASIAYKSEDYMLAIKLYKDALALKVELELDYFLKIAKSYSCLGKDREAKKYFKAINLVNDNTKDLIEEDIQKRNRMR